MGVNKGTRSPEPKIQYDSPLSTSFHHHYYEKGRGYYLLIGLHKSKVYRSSRPNFRNNQKIEIQKTQISIGWDQENSLMCMRRAYELLHLMRWERNTPHFPDLKEPQVDRRGSSSHGTHHRFLHRLFQLTFQVLGQLSASPEANSFSNPSSTSRCL